MEYGYREEKESAFRSVIKEWPILLVEVVVAILLAVLLIVFGFEKTQVNGKSMDPVLKDGDVIFVSKIAYIGFKPKRNDVIVYRQDGKEHSYNSVKRVIGLPGEKVQIKDGKVYINDKEYKEINKVDAMISGGVAEDPIELDKGEYFVLGDNRNQSEDSRYSSVGMIKKKEIVGKAWLRLKPNFNFVSWIKAQDAQAKETE
jgi:signal peptidase I